MNQDDIFKLLLIILLMSNEKGNCPTATTSSGFSNLNEIIIISLLLSACSGNNFSDNILPSTENTTF